MDATQLKFVLEGLHFSAALPPDLIERLANGSKVQRTAAGQILFREGSDNDNFYLIRSGRIALEMAVPGRGRIRILTVGPGDMVGWSSLLVRGRMTATAIAVEETELVVAAGEDLRNLCQTNHEFGFYLMQRMADALSRRLVATRLQLLDLFADTTHTHVGTVEGP